MGPVYDGSHHPSEFTPRPKTLPDNIQQSKSKYYSYAASDMKKAIDYGEGLEDCPQLPQTEDYLRTLYEQHKRKTALWPLMTDKIKGLSVGKDGLSYNGDVS